QLGDLCVPFGDDVALGSEGVRVLLDRSLKLGERHSVGFCQLRAQLLIFALESLDLELEAALLALELLNADQQARGLGGAVCADGVAGKRRSRRRLRPARRLGRRIGRHLRWFGLTRPARRPLAYFAVFADPLVQLSKLDS